MLVNKLQKSLIFPLIIIVGLLLCGCASQPSPDIYVWDEPPGFFHGLWHGCTIFISIIGHIFNSSIRIYSFPNSGGWYDFGYFIGISFWWIWLAVLGAH